MPACRPFVVGVLADLSGMPEAPLPKLKDRHFVTVTPDTFPQLFRHVHPQINVTESTGNRTLTFKTFEVLSQSDHPGIANLLATWTGLRFLVESVAGVRNVKVKALDLSKKDLVRDLTRALEFDQSALYKKIYADEAGTFGGDPYSCLVLDHSLAGDWSDVNPARRVAQVASSAGAPILYHGIQEPRRTLIPEPVQGSKSCSDESWLRTDSYFVFGLTPRFRIADTTPQVWINPAFLAAALIARTLRGKDIREVAAALNPSLAFQTPAGGLNSAITPPDRIEFETASDFGPADEFESFGCNRLSANFFSRPDWPHDVLSASDPCASCDLAQALMMGATATHLRHHLRRARRVDSANELLKEASAWLSGNVPEELSLGMAAGVGAQGEVHVRFMLPARNSPGSPAGGVRLCVAEGLGG